MSLFECKNLSKEFEGFKLENINITLDPGEILGVIGVNGCGKTTMLRSIMGSYRLTGKENTVLKIKDIDQEADIKAYKKETAWIMQDQPFGKSMTPGMIGELYGAYYEGFDNEKYERLLKEYEIPFATDPKNKVNAEMQKLSKGQQLRVQLAFALPHEASLYVLDEPTGNLDVDFRDEFYRTMREMVSDEKHSVIIASHIVEELESFADRILWLYRDGEYGRQRFYGSIDELRDRFRVAEGDEKILAQIPESAVTGKRFGTNNKKILVDTTKYEIPEELKGYCRMADLREIMYFIEKEKGV